MRSLLKTLLYTAGYSIKKIRHVPRIARGVGTETVSGADIMQLLHKTNPYEGFDFHARPLDAHGWGGQSPAFRELISRARPRLIVDVGHGRARQRWRWRP